MLSSLYSLARTGLFTLPPEEAHELTLRLLENGIYLRDTTPNFQETQIELFGLRFPNPIGIAAGFDKDSRVPNALLDLGCGFAEVGTLTPLPQPGNPSPRVFRLIEEGGLINRLGFNNGGHAAALSRLQMHPPKGILCVNVGANKNSTDRTADYVQGVETFYDFASMFTINISSPNTPGLRDLQAPAALDELLGRVIGARKLKIQKGRPSKPIIVKLSPDIQEHDLHPIIERLISHSVEGIAVSNTTIHRSGVKDPKRTEEGGLSGKPLFHRATVMLAKIHLATSGKIPLIGIGGIDSAESALKKIEAGASLLQLYTGLIYEGPALIGSIKKRLAEAVRASGKRHITDLIGTKAHTWSELPLEPKCY